MMLTYHISHEKISLTALYVPGRSGVKATGQIAFDAICDYMSRGCTNSHSVNYYHMRFIYSSFYDRVCTRK